MCDGSGLLFASRRRRFPSSDAPGCILFAAAVESMDWLTLRNAMSLQGRNNPMVLMLDAPDAQIVEAMRMAQRR